MLVENIIKNLSGKSSQKRIDNAKQSAADALKTSSIIVIQETAEATGDLIGNKINNKITKISQIEKQNNSDTATNEHYKEIPRQRCISPKERQKINDDLRLI